MYSVTFWIKNILSLPRNIWDLTGKVEVQDLDPYEGVYPPSVETLDPSRMGVLVDYLSRLIISGDFKHSFISLEKAFLVLKNSDKVEEMFFWDRYGIDMEKKFRNACECDVKWEKFIFKNDDSIRFCAELSVFDTYFRSGKIVYPDSIKVDDNTIHNLRVMVKRVVDFLREKKGIAVGDSITGFTTLITSGDWDFVSKKEVIDIKVLRTNSIQRQCWIQLLVYFLLGRESKDFRFRHIENLTIFNPRLNRVYTIKVKDIPKEAIKQIKEQWGETIELTGKKLMKEDTKKDWY